MNIMLQHCKVPVRWPRAPNFWKSCTFRARCSPPPYKTLIFLVFRKILCRKLKKGEMKCMKKKSPPPAEGGRQEVKKSHS